MEEPLPPKHILEARTLAASLCEKPLLEQNDFVTEVIKCLKVDRKNKIETHNGHLQRLGSAEDDLRVAINTHIN